MMGMAEEAPPTVKLPRVQPGLVRAWSDDPEPPTPKSMPKPKPKPKPQPRVVHESWAATWWNVLVLLMVGLVVAFVIAVVGWTLSQGVDQQPSPKDFHGSSYAPGPF
jgi:hypothetical protein